MTSTGVAAIGLSSRDGTLLAKEPETAAVPMETGTAGMPMGRIGDVKISRLFLGGNQFWGGVHSRDLEYIRPLLQRYYADEEKILDALELDEENGINTICHYENGIDGLCGTFLSSYWKKRGSKMQYLAWVHCPWDEMLAGTDLIESTQRAIDDGAIAVYIRGCEADRWVQHNKMELHRDEDVDFEDREPVFEQLFDLENDPEEKNNLAESGRHVQELERLRRKCRHYSSDLIRRKKAYRDYLRGMVIPG